MVVMSQQPKLEMEATFRRIIPDEQRFGTRFVFREGSALIPDNLRMVAASQAAATIVVSDSSRYRVAQLVTLLLACLFALIIKSCLLLEWIALCHGVSGGFCSVVMHTHCCIMLFCSVVCLRVLLKHACLVRALAVHSTVDALQQIIGVDRCRY